mmetsp:Transcript_57225/g.119651  ORF Transcript_57225/g.119651 Transcript_57225/m.119651 type:complete len:87 (-) Transcript_57225:156-416(-)
MVRVRRSMVELAVDADGDACDDEEGAGDVGWAQGGLAEEDGRDEGPEEGDGVGDGHRHRDVCTSQRNVVDKRATLVYGERESVSPV